jgi:hypothetical protein
MSNLTNVNRVLIGDGANATPAPTHLSGIKKGDLIFFDEKNNVIANATQSEALAKHEKITLAVGIADGEAILSSPIQGNTASRYTGTTSVSPAELSVILGYNGTVGTGISVDAESDYRLRVLIKDANRVNGMRPTLSDVNYQAGVNDTAETVLSKIVCLYAQKDYDHNYMSDKIKLLRVSDGTFTALTNDIVLVDGSKIATSVAHGITAGEYIRYSGTGDQSPIIKVEEVIDANTVKFDVAFNEGVTITVPAANVGIMTAQTEFGFKMNGVPQSSDISRGANEPVDQYEWINYDAAFTDANDLASSQYAALKTVVRELNPGQGYWKQVADVEEAAKGYLGDTSKRRYHDNRIDSNVVVGTAYDSIIIVHADIHTGSHQDTYRAPLKTEIFIPTGGTGQGDEAVATSFVSILNGFFGSKVGFPLIDFTPV